MITEADWELIQGALADVVASDLSEDADQAADLIRRIESGEAQAPMKPDITAMPKGPSNRDVAELLSDLARLVDRGGVGNARNLMHRGSGGYPEDWHYQYGKSTTDPWVYQQLLKQPIDPKACLKVTTSW
jgi:hypothetical protein